MEKPYHTIHKNDTQALVRFLTQNAQTLLPMVELIEQSQLAVDQLMDVLGPASIEGVLRLLAEGIAGPPHPGRKGGAFGWHSTETGTVALLERKLRVGRPRLRKKGTGRGGEVPIPAYAAMQEDGKLAQRMLEILLRGVSTRQYQKILPEMAETVGISKPSVSAEAIAASEEQLRQLCARQNPGQRCLQHKLENVMGYLPEHLKGQVKAALQAAFRLPAEEGMARLEKQARWLGASRCRR